MKSPQSSGGIARAAKLSPKQRSEIAREAAQARWARGKGDIAPPSTSALAARLRAHKTALMKRARQLRQLAKEIEAASTEADQSLAIADELIASLR